MKLKRCVKEPITRGYDEFIFAESEYSYPTVTVKGGKSVPNPWISIATGETTRICLSTPEGYDAKKFALISARKQESINYFESNNIVFYIKAMEKEGFEWYFLVYKGNKIDTLGGLSVITYAPKKFDLKIIPLGNTSLSDNYAENLKMELDEIFSQAVAEWNVEMVSPFNLASGTPSQISIPNSDKYNDAMKAVVDNFKKINKPQKKVLYLFVAENLDGEKTFFIPKGGQHGFISKNALPREIAQAAMRGLFKMDYIYNVYKSASAGTTDNLMDNGNGVKLIKVQWDAIR